MHDSTPLSLAAPLLDVEVFPLFVATRGAQGEVQGYCKGLLSASPTEVELQVRGWWHPSRAAPKFELYDALARAVVQAICQHAELYPSQYAACSEVRVNLVDARVRKTFPLHLGLLNASVNSCFRDLA